MQKVLTLLCAASLLAGGVHAQTRPARKPAAPAAKPAAKPAATSTPKAPQKATKLTPPTAAPVVAAAPAPPAQPAAPAPALAPAQAASASFGPGSGALNLGIGFGLGYGSLLGGASTFMPALSASYMRGLAAAGPGTISVGGLVGYQRVGWESGAAKATWRNFYAGGRGAYHYSFGNPKLDTYAGLGLGLRIISYSANFEANASASASQAELSGFVGARYFFTDKLGAFSELGYDMSYLKVGVSARF